MEKRIWMTAGVVTKADGVAGSPAVTVRRAEPLAGIMYDGIWLDGNRSYETYVLIDGGSDYYHTPRKDLADASFILHEAQGGGYVP